MVTMSRILSSLLGVHEEVIKTDIQRLEAGSGLPGHDVRLTAEIIGKVHMKTRELGFDPKDTTGRELYQALLNLVTLHDNFLVKKIGGRNAANAQDLLPRIRQTVLDSKFPKTAWVLKSNAAKRLILASPPRQVMKYLGYKSLDSMVKRESCHELFAGIRLLESKTWIESFIRRYKDLRQSDFEVKPIQIVQLDANRWETASKQYVERHRTILLEVREIGALFLLPAPIAARPGLTVTVLYQLLHHINEIRLYSTFYQLHQMRAGFGEMIANSLLRDEDNHLHVSGQKIHWRVAQRHFGRPGNHPEALEPHVQPNDLSWRKAEETLYRLEPALHFWHDYDYVAVMHDGRPLSFNLLDTALNYFNGFSYEDRLYGHFQDSLWNELFVRYMGQPALEAQVLKQLDSDVSAQDLLAIASRKKV